MNGVISPISLIGVLVLLVLRLGPTGLVAIGVIVVLLPIQALISINNSKLIQQVNVPKDKRVKVCTEIIEGIKYIKLYGWEIAFKNIIQQLR